MLTRAQKKEIIEKLRKKIRENQISVFFNFFGISVQRERELKKECQKNEIENFVTKRTLLEKALEKENINFPEIKGPVMVAFGKDEVLVPKTFFEFSQKKFERKKEKINFIGGILRQNQGFSILLPEDLLFLAKIPSKRELFVRLVFLLKFPISGLINILKGNFQKFLFLLKSKR